MEPTAGSTSSTETEREPAERIALGRVVGAHGMGGQLRVRYFGGAPDNLMRLEDVLLAESEDAADAERFEVIRAAPGRREEVRMTLSGVSDRESAERLRGKLVVVEAAQLEALPEGEYYSYQLIGCRVEGADGQSIGTVREVWATGAVDVLVVEDENGVRHLIPAAESQLRMVDLEMRRIVIEILPGLLDSL
jgi:16S rRNA processing protein RimM